MPSSRFLSRLPSLILKRSKPESASSLPKFLMNLFAWFYGSIMSGHLRDLNIMIPFSIDRLSLGREAAVHILVLTGSSSKDFIVMLSEQSMCNLLIPSLHWASSSYLKLAVKAPAYATIPAPMRQFPIRRPYSLSSLPTVAVHLVFSPSSPEMILLALSNFL